MDNIEGLATVTSPAGRPILLTAFIFLLSSCVSIELGEEKVKRAVGVEYNDPPQPYEQFGTENLDAAWRNPSNGNAISFLSECEPQVEPPLPRIKEGVLRDMTHLKINEEKRLTFNGREALRTKAQGRVDGVPTQVDLMVFKKNNCIYVLTYVALKDAYEPGLLVFEEFLKGFRAP